MPSTTLPILQEIANPIFDGRRWITCFSPAQSLPHLAAPTMNQAMRRMRSFRLGRTGPEAVYLRVTVALACHGIGIIAHVR